MFVFFMHFKIFTCVVVVVVVVVGGGGGIIGVVYEIDDWLMTQSEIEAKLM